MLSQSVIIRLFCLSFSAIAANAHLPYEPVLIESRPPPLPIYGPQIPIVAASVKSPPVVAAVKAPLPHVHVPLPPVHRARIGVKTVFRPPPPAPQVVQQVAQPYVQPVSFNIEQHELVGVPEPYNFNYEHKDDTGNGQYRRESGDTNGVVRGSYGYTDAYGLYRIVDYVADKDGFRASIRTNEPGLNEPHPISGTVPNPADITLAAEETPGRVKDLIRLAPIKQWDGQGRHIRAPASNSVDNKYVSRD
ncbi:unnamed protein product [Medioppia subpectinata]|uniref:Cuticle protein n=1 Tax=Medioppia subpectinata TaxID=1979941 RepID=A0A7R9KD19_9ACAR|nr:unnamed protein product [Medioppia subpectinata]CAG2101265.1 unnamed protein product [Medioppia subpectinata]